MDYEFVVPLPFQPPGATELLWEVVTYPQHTTGVNEIIQFTDPDPTTGLPRIRIRLPYRDADNGIYARTLKFAWNVPNLWPGTRRHVQMSRIVVNQGSDDDSANGKWQMWTDVAGHWSYLTGLYPGAFPKR